MTKDTKNHFCHWCRSIAKFGHVQCCRCPLKYCRRCLLLKQGENILEETEPEVQWVCPKCRGGCGPGCQNCCTCSICRRAQALVPVGNEPFLSLMKNQETDGFSNVHDYLIYLKTGDSKESISLRKHSRGWTKSGTKKKKKVTRLRDFESADRCAVIGHKKTHGTMVEVEIKYDLPEFSEEMICISYPAMDYNPKISCDSHGSYSSNPDPEDMCDSHGSYPNNLSGSL